MSRIAVALESAVGPLVGPLVGTGAVPEGPAQVWPIGKGQVPDTLGDDDDDGEPVEALVLMSSPAVPGSTVQARPVAVLHLSGPDGHAEELLCVADDPCFAELEDAPDLPQWHAAPSSWAGALARLSSGTGTEVTGLESWVEADRLLAQAQYAYRQLTGCLE